MDCACTICAACSFCSELTHSKFLLFWRCCNNVKKPLSQAAIISTWPSRLRAWLCICSP